MEQEKIRELLNRYFEGNTSEEEEAQLRKYLSDPSRSSTVRAGYGFIPGMTPEIPEPSEGFYERLQEIACRPAEKPRLTRVLRYVLGTAAAAAIFTGALLLFDYFGRGELRDTYKDPEIAMAEVRNILLAVSEKMTTGTEPLGSINSINTAPESLSGFKILNSVVEDNLSRLHYLDRLTNPQQNKENQ
ncbi:MAG: hypothetical protein IH592_04535 [Bacteroidales bacterium]|nr:hypothetical protein [Bacteroidales bacterium]